MSAANKAWTHRLTVGAMGCVAIGVGGLLGLAAGLALGTVPAPVTSRVR